MCVCCFFVIQFLMGKIWLLMEIKRVEIKMFVCDEFIHRVAVQERLNEKSDTKAVCFAWVWGVLSSHRNMQQKEKKNTKERKKKMSYPVEAFIKKWKLISCQLFAEYCHFFIHFFSLSLFLFFIRYCSFLFHQYSNSNSNISKPIHAQIFLCRFNVTRTHAHNHIRRMLFHQINCLLNTHSHIFIYPHHLTIHTNAY